MTVPIGSIRLYDEVDPVLTAGVYRVSSSAEIADANDATDTLDAPPPDRLHVEVGGPRFRLGPADIAAVHPARGASGAFGDRLPHVVLGRHTLPWERRATGDTPWLAVLVARADEVTLVGGPLKATLGAAVFAAMDAVEPTDPDEPVTAARFTDAGVLGALLPSRADVGLLAHVRQVNLADTALDLGDDDGWFAVVAANRLPRDADGTGTPYVAMLASLEARDDLWALPATGPAPAVLVLASWEFTCAGGGTFERLCAGLDLAAFGGAAADGAVALDHTDRTGLDVPARYRGPLVGAPPGEQPPVPLDGDVSADAAFELGRLAGIADGRFTREIVAWHRAVDAAARTPPGARTAAELRRHAAPHPTADPRVHPAGRPPAKGSRP